MEIVMESHRICRAQKSMNPEPETSSCSLMHPVTKQEHFSSEQADNPRQRKQVFLSKQNPKVAPRQQSLSSFSSTEPVVSFGFASGSGDEN